MISATLRSRDVWLPPLAIAALVLLLALGGEAARTALRFDHAAIAGGAVWRLLTGNFVHLGWAHVALNLAGLGLLVLLCPDRLAWLVWLRRLVLVGTGMGACLYFLVDVGWYVGFSGVLHGLFLLGLGRQVVVERDWIAAASLAVLLGKVVWEMATGVPVSDEKMIGGRVLVESHLYGALSALLYGFVFRSFTRVETTGFREKKTP